MSPEYPQGIRFFADDIWSAYETGAREARSGDAPSDAIISRAADAYTKLQHARVRDGELDRPHLSEMGTPRPTAKRGAILKCVFAAIEKRDGLTGSDLANVLSEVVPSHTVDRRKLVFSTVSYLIKCGRVARDSRGGLTAVDPSFTTTDSTT